MDSVTETGDDLGKFSAAGEVDDDGEVSEPIEATIDDAWGPYYGCQNCNLRKWDCVFLKCLVDITR